MLMLPLVSWKACSASASVNMNCNGAAHNGKALLMDTMLNNGLNSTVLPVFAGIASPIIRPESAVRSPPCPKHTSARFVSVFRWEENALCHYVGSMVIGGVLNDLPNGFNGDTLKHGCSRTVPRRQSV